MRDCRTCNKYHNHKKINHSHDGHSSEHNSYHGRNGQCRHNKHNSSEHNSYHGRNGQCKQCRQGEHIGHWAVGKYKHSCKPRKCSNSIYRKQHKYLNDYYAGTINNNHYCGSPHPTHKNINIFAPNIKCRDCQCYYIRHLLN